MRGLHASSTQTSMRESIHAISCDFLSLQVHRTIRLGRGKPSAISIILAFLLVFTAYLSNVKNRLITSQARVGVRSGRRLASRVQLMQGKPALSSVHATVTKPHFLPWRARV